jgi:hypothetical protein
MTHFFWRTSMVVVLILTIGACKRKSKASYGDTPFTDVLVVVEKEFIPEFYWPYHEGQHPGMAWAPPEWHTVFSGDSIERFSSTSRSVYENTEVDDVVEVRFRKEQNGGSRCAIDELRLASGETFSDLQGSCTLREGAREAEYVDAVDQSGDLSEGQAEEPGELLDISPVEVQATLDVLPELLDNLDSIPRAYVVNALDYFADFLAATPGIPLEQAQQFSNILADYLESNPNIPAEYLDRCLSILSDHKTILPNLSPEVLQRLSSYSLTTSEQRQPSPTTGYFLPVVRQHLQLRPEILRHNLWQPAVTASEQYEAIMEQQSPSGDLLLSPTM